MLLRPLKLKEGLIDQETRLRSRNHDQARIAQALDVNHVCCMFPERHRLVSVILLTSYRYPSETVRGNGNATSLHDATESGYNHTNYDYNSRLINSTLIQLRSKEPGRFHYRTC
jgi:hypothetical protein